MFFIYLMTIENEYDRQSVEQLYYRYRYHCLHLARIYTQNNDELAEDIVQSFFLKIIKNHKKFLAMSKEKFEGLLPVMLKNLVIDYYRGSVKYNRGLEIHTKEMQQTSISVEDKLFTVADLKRVVEVVEQLSEREQTILRYRALKIPIKEIAQIMGIKSKNVEVILYRARKKVKEKLANNGMFE